MQSIAVFTGSRSGTDPAHEEIARSFGELLARSGIRLVYGGGSTGLMGCLADGAIAGGGEVVGVIPGFLYDKEIAHSGLSELEVVSGMHERKARFAELAEAFVALPGGFGTLDELFEALTWGQLGLHKSPVGLVNTGGYYDGLISFMDQMLSSGFIRDEHRQAILMADNGERLVRKLRGFQPQLVNKWK